MVNVARASMEELLLDCKDFLLHRRLPLWTADSPEASAVRSVPRRFREEQSNRTDLSDLTDLSDQQLWSLYAKWLDRNDPVVRANAIVCVIHQCNYLLDQQIAALEKQFISEGGYSEQLAAARLAEAREAERSSGPVESDKTNWSDSELPAVREGDGDSHGQAVTKCWPAFCRCIGYPDCKGTMKA